MDSTVEIHESVTALKELANLARDIVAKGKEKSQNSTDSIELTGQALGAMAKAVSTMRVMNTALESTIEQQDRATDAIHQNISTIRKLADSCHAGAKSLVLAGEFMSKVPRGMPEVVKQ